ncbi:Decaprenyl-diphosphate synthase subunit 1, partial [Eschrichtius robustus]|nr:Decaprenyl-diphosphate synthase subunit 1 [Eschrichtius robustus]
VSVLGCPDPVVHEIAYQYGKNVGLAFQLIDDVLDFTSCSDRMGKPTSADLKLGLATGPVLFACQQKAVGKGVKRHIVQPWKRDTNKAEQDVALDRTCFLSRLIVLPGPRTEQNTGVDMGQRLPLLCTSSSLDPDTGFPEMNAMIMRRFSSPGDVDRARQYVLQVRRFQEERRQQSDGVQQTTYLAQRYCREAVREISKLRPSPERDALIQLSEIVLTRDK